MNKKKEIEHAKRACSAADIAMAYDFRHEHYTHSGFDEPTYRTSFRMIPGNTYIIVDRNCESHFIAFPARFVKCQRRGGFMQEKEFMVFQIDQDQSDRKKGDYFLVQPTISIDIYDNKMSIELSSYYSLSKLGQKIITREREYI